MWGARDLEHLCYRYDIAASCDDAPRGRPPFERAVRSCQSRSEVLEVNVTTGTIKKVVADRGFGFIAADDAKEYFFHRGGLDSSLDFDRLVGGEKVEFEIEQSPKGPRANRVHAA
jgi:CspA family cold shock protein